MKSYVLAITGASGADYGLEALRQLLAKEDIHTHLIISPWAEDVVIQETGMPFENHLERLSEDETSRLTVHDHGDLAAPISNGSYPVDGMLIAPCSMRTLCSIAAGPPSNLIDQAALFMMKKHRPLVMLARETPLSTFHLEQMAAVSRAGATVMPPLPALYLHPSSIEEMLELIILRALMCLGALPKPQKGLRHEPV